MKVITSKIFKGKKMFLIDDENYQDGGVIEDNQGQWKYPGQITKINSNNITMKGVPYPVYGVSDIGDKQMMYPNGEYKFKGNSVTEYPILAQAGTTVKINKDNIIREYDIRSPEYKQMYDSGNLMSYDKTTDTYIATPLQTHEVKTNAPQWLLDKRKIEQNYTKEKFVKKSLPKWANSVGETADNLSENAQKDYEKKVNDKLANIILKRNPKLGKSTEDRLKWAESLTEKERDIVNRSSYANKFLPAMNAYNENQSNLTKNYSTRALLLDADKLAQSVEGTPERFRLFPNAENNVESYINPGVLLGQMAKGLGNVPKDIKEGNNLKAALSIANPIGFGALAGIGNPSTGQFVNNLANPLAGTGEVINNLGNKYLPNAYKLNPLAKKVESFNNPNSFYRQVDDETFKEGLESGLIKGKQNVDKTRGESIINLNKSFGDDAYYKKSSLYSPQRADYIYEVQKGEEAFIPKVNNRTRGYTTENTPIRVSREPIPLTEANIYKKDWLKGYKPIEIPKKGFNSEINWGKWNKEIPENTQLMQEYNAIEQQTKANDTWMKNPDGSTFQGTPEQFVQQNSSNFMKAFPKGYEKGYRGDMTGNVNITGDVGNNRTIFVADKETGKHYAGSNGNLFELYHPKSENSIRFNNQGRSWRTISRTPFGENPPDLDILSGRLNTPQKGNYTSTDDIAEWIQKNNKDYVNIDNIFDGTDAEFVRMVNHKPGNYLKSAIGNNGMFDMTNPNIYKSIVGALATGTLGKQAMQKKEFGGKILDTRIVNGQKQYLINE